MNDHALVDIPDLKHDNTRQPMIVLSHAHPKTDALLTACTNIWETTAHALLARAKELYSAANDLEDRARELLERREYIDNVRSTIQFETECRNRVASLMFVNPTKDD